jgi:hypothetical protein
MIRTSSQEQISKQKVGDDENGIRGAHNTHFDGNGKLTQLDSIILNGCHSPKLRPTSFAAVTLLRR